MNNDAPEVHVPESEWRGANAPRPLASIGLSPEQAATLHRSAVVGGRSQLDVYSQTAQGALTRAGCDVQLHRPVGDQQRTWVAMRGDGACVMSASPGYLGGYETVVLGKLTNDGMFERMADTRPQPSSLEDYGATYKDIKRAFAVAVGAGKSKSTRGVAPLVFAAHTGEILHAPTASEPLVVVETSEGSLAAVGEIKNADGEEETRFVILTPPRVLQAAIGAAGIEKRPASGKEPSR